MGVPMGPFVLPQACKSGIRSYEVGGGEGVEFHEVFLQYRLEELVGAMA